jgi:hypothetical protein
VQPLYLSVIAYELGLQAPGDLDQCKLLVSLAETDTDTTLTGYSRSVLIIATEAGALYAEQSAGVSYHLAKLRKHGDLKEPSPQNRKAADRVLRSLSRTNYGVDSGAIKFMLNLAGQWKDSKMWNELVNKASSTPANLGLPELVQSMPIFGFQAVKPQ